MNPSTMSVKKFWRESTLTAPLRSFLSSAEFYTSREDYKCHIIALVEYKCLYFAIPKVANSTLRRIFSDLTGEDLRASTTGRFDSPLSVKKSLVKKHFQSYYKFGFVRNPYDRVVSAYTDKVISSGKAEFFFPDYITRKGLVNGEISFEKFVHLLMEIPDSDANRHYMSQHKFLTDEYSGDLLVDYFGKLESLQEDISFVANKAGFEVPTLYHKNKSKRKRDFRDYYTPELKKLVSERYSKDIEMFEYEF